MKMNDEMEKALEIIIKIGNQRIINAKTDESFYSGRLKTITEATRLGTFTQSIFISYTILFAIVYLLKNKGVILWWIFTKKRRDWQRVIYSLSNDEEFKENMYKLFTSGGRDLSNTFSPSYFVENTDSIYFPTIKVNAPISNFNINKTNQHLRGVIVKNRET